MFFHLTLLHAHRFPCHCSVQDSDGLIRSARSTSNCRHAPRHLSTNRLEVTVHKAYEEHTNHYASFSSPDVQLPDNLKPNEIKLDKNMEDREEK